MKKLFTQNSPAELAAANQLLSNLDNAMLQAGNEALLQQAARNEALQEATSPTALM